MAFSQGEIGRNERETFHKQAHLLYTQHKQGSNAIYRQIENNTTVRWVVTSLYTEGGGWSLACIQRGWVVLKPGSRAYVLYELPLFQSGTELLSTSGRDDRHSRLGVFFLIHLNSLITQHCHSAY